MPRSPSWAKVATLCFMIWGCLQAVALETANNRYLPRQVPPVQPPNPPSKNNGNTTHLLCTPFGACEPCPPKAMMEPFCQPFGNRRLMHCVNNTFVRDPADHTTETPNQSTAQTAALHPEGETLAWESCGRIVTKERADFYEFVAFNVAFAIVALGVLLFRSRRMQVNQARQLAARIGLIRGEGGRIMRP